MALTCLAGRHALPRESLVSHLATPWACSLASEAFRCHRLALLPGATSCTCLPGNREYVLPAQLRLQPTFGRHRPLGLHDWPIPVFFLSPLGSHGGRRQMP